MASYAEKLKDPRWQKKRLKVLERDGFECTDCGDDKKTLHVHHLNYAKSGNPWDSKLDDLETLCEDCHGEHEHLKDVKKSVAEYLRDTDTSEKIMSFELLCDLLEFDEVATYKLMNSVRHLYTVGWSNGKKYQKKVTG